MTGPPHQLVRDASAHYGIFTFRGITITDSATRSAIKDPHPHPNLPPEGEGIIFSVSEINRFLRWFPLSHHVTASLITHRGVRSSFIPHPSSFILGFFSPSPVTRRRPPNGRREISYYH